MKYLVLDEVKSKMTDPWGIPRSRHYAGEASLNVLARQQALFRQTSGGAPRHTGIVIPSYHQPTGYIVPPFPSAPYGGMMAPVSAPPPQAYVVPRFPCSLCGIHNHTAPQCPYKQYGSVYCEVCQGYNHDGLGCPSIRRLGRLMGRCSNCGRSDHADYACTTICQCYGCKTPRSHTTAQHHCGKCGGHAHSLHECISP
jgi:hypothetical protein